MSRPPKNLSVAVVKAGKPSPPSDRKLFVTMRYDVASTSGCPPILIEPATTFEPAAAAGFQV